MGFEFLVIENYYFLSGDILLFGGKFVTKMHSLVQIRYEAYEASRSPGL